MTGHSPVRHVNPCIILLAFVAMTGCTRFDILNATIPSCGYIRTSNLPYANLPRQKLDVYVPRHAKSNTPTVVFFYGGDWQNGNKTDYRFVAQAITSKGFIAVLPDYRLYPSVTFPAFVNDAALAVRWVHDHITKFGGDPRLVFLAGHSAGAHIVALLTLDKRYLQHVGLHRNVIRATAGLSGPYDFVPSPPDRGVFSMPLTDTTPPPDIEPINFVDGSAPPMLLIQGLADPTVNPSNATELAAKIRAAGGTVRCITYPGVGHVAVVLSFAWPFRCLAPTLRDVMNYFKQLDALPGH
ncbi:MAG TPA: alpha/beta hydrolase [Tepidisphaeraceae bacterium]|nr:alpha/beta hydrolase [Tepidisphaeraceae bacterium]